MRLLLLCLGVLGTARAGHSARYSPHQRRKRAAAAVAACATSADHAACVAAALRPPARPRPTPKPSVRAERSPAPTPRRAAPPPTPPAKPWYLDHHRAAPRALRAANPSRRLQEKRSGRSVKRVCCRGGSRRRRGALRGCSGRPNGRAIERDEDRRGADDREESSRSIVWPGAERNSVGGRVPENPVRILATFEVDPMR